MLRFSNSIMLLTIILMMTSLTCKVKQDQTGVNGASGKTIEKRQMPEVLPPPSAEELAEKEVSYNLIEELANFLGQQKDFSEYAALVGRLKGKHLFSNAAHQGYRIFVLSNADLSKLPDHQHKLLTDDSGTNAGYQMKFFINHTCPEPNNPYPGYAYRTLSGQNLSFKTDSVSMPDLKSVAAYRKIGMAGSKLSIYQVTGPLFY